MANKVEYYYKLDIEQCESLIRENKDDPIISLNIEDDPLKKYFKIIYRENQQIDRIECYNLGKLKYFVKYSHKGNLINITEFPNDKLHKMIKTNFDYSFGSKKIKERRFYNKAGYFCKMEVYGQDENLLAIFYFKDGVYYCVERFSIDGRLTEVTYFDTVGFPLQLKETNL